MEESPRDLVRNRVKEKLAGNELVLSMAVRLVRSIEIVSIAQSAGFDSFYVDLEHSSFSLEATSQLCIAGLSLGVTPFVRVPSISPDCIAGVLDGGALGVIAPHVQGADEAARVVRAAKYPPSGSRSFTGALPHVRFRSFPAIEVSAAIDAATMVIIMIESAAALEAAEAIAAVEGVDMLFIGTNDLCAELGIPGQLDHPTIRQAYATCMRACASNGKHLGIGGLNANPALAADFVKLGARYVSTGTDLSFLAAGAAAKTRQMRERFSPPSFN
ncbi:aldolase [Pigmentiphaga sp. H8]|uniref:HpcH/HpaI aldolase family protein n=1 Tax=Pigmentiphaga sp. H8 TaxID=2488560 RepID=UPI000F599B3F|nr:aldolase/citrate lyase family protein [Pigmentiphaga sp. H8]AZG07851.1 aldolase [Pigmentiphaga sp. H8]